MPEYSDYKPAPWSRDSFKSARATYDEHVGRSYEDARDKGVKSSDLVPERIITNVRTPIIILCDQTGSMGSWPATIFSKLGYLDHEAKFYFGEDYAIAFGAFGDANCHEHYPVQLRPFAKGSELPERLKELVIEGGGGSGLMESAELPALYVNNNIEAPDAIRPIVILITDEKCYETINPEQAKQWCKVELQQRLTTKALFESLKSKWSVYLIRKPYGRSEGNEEGSINREIREFWESLVGADHISFLPDAARVVDVIFGIFAQETGKIEEFEKELKDRQLKDEGGEKKVATVLRALGTIHRTTAKKLPSPDAINKVPEGEDAHHSVTRREPGTTTVRSKSLLD